MKSLLKGFAFSKIILYDPELALRHIRYYGINGSKIQLSERNTK